MNKKSHGRIPEMFARLRRQKKKAFIAFLTAGYPDMVTTSGLVRQLDLCGVSLIELGVPFSDPVADGKMIQEASVEALKKGAGLVSIIRLVRKLRDDGINVPICLMSYYNPVFCMGLRKFFREASRAGVDGIIIPDLPPEEAGDLKREAAAQGVDTIFFVSPQTRDERLKTIIASSSGFIYCVSVSGVTGQRSLLPAEVLDNVRRIKRRSKKPVCVGFGVSTPGQVRDIWKIADGVIVGSAIIKKIKDHAGQRDLVKKVSEFVKQLMGD